MNFNFQSWRIFILMHNELDYDVLAPVWKDHWTMLLYRRKFSEYDLYSWTSRTTSKDLFTLAIAFLLSFRKGKRYSSSFLASTVQSSKVKYLYKISESYWIKTSPICLYFMFFGRWINCCYVGQYKNWDINKVTNLKFFRKYFHVYEKSVKMRKLFDYTLEDVNS